MIIWQIDILDIPRNCILQPLQTYSKIDYFELLQPGRTETTKLRKRRQIEVDYRGCEYPAELCEVEMTIMNLYDSLNQLPYTDDLGPFMADINHKIADILELKLKVSLF